MFASMLNLPMREASERLIQIEDMSARALEEFLFFLYTGRFRESFDVAVRSLPAFAGPCSTRASLDQMPLCMGYIRDAFDATQSRLLEPLACHPNATFSPSLLSQPCTMHMVHCAPPVCTVQSILSRHTQALQGCCVQRALDTAVRSFLILKAATAHTSMQELCTEILAAAQKYDVKDMEETLRPLLDAQPRENGTASTALEDLIDRLGTLPLPSSSN